MKSPIKSWHGLLLLALFSWTLPVSHAAAAEPVSVEITSLYMSDNSTVQVSAQIKSPTSVKNVSASLEHLTVALSQTCSPLCTWNGTIPLEGMAKGSKEVTVSAENINRETGSAAASFSYDAAPELQVHEPKNQSVVPGSLRVHAAASDDLSEPSLLIHVMQDGYELEELIRATGGIDQVLDLSAYDGQTIELRFTALDESGKSQESFRTVHVETSSQLHPAAQVDGTLVDADETRLLYMGHDGQLRIRERSGTQEHVIWEKSLLPVSESHLTSTGAVFLAPAAEGSAQHKLYVWRESGLFEVPATLSSSPSDIKLLQTQGDYAVYTVIPTFESFRLQTSTGDITPLPAQNHTVNGAFITEQGEVYYTAHGLYKMNATGEVSTLFERDAETYYGPLVDEKTLLYDDSYAIYHSVDGEERLLANASLEGAAPYRDYQIHEGWIAFLKSDDRGLRQIFLRNPAGEERQLTSFEEGTLTIDRLMSNGDITYSYNNRTYLHSGDEEPQLLSSANGRNVSLSDGLYKILGNSLLKMGEAAGDVTPPEWTAGADILRASEVTAQEVVLTWPAASDEKAIRGYHIYQDGVELSFTDADSLSYRATGLLPQHSYEFKIAAEDEAGNRSVQQPTLSVTTLNYGSEPQISYHLKKNTLKVGGKVEITVQAEQAEDLYAYLLKYKYNPEQLQFLQAKLHHDFGKENKDAVFARYSKEPGSLQVSGTRIGQAPAASSPQLVTLEFKILQAGDALVTLLPGSRIVPIEGEPLPLNKQTDWLIQVNP